MYGVNTGLDNATQMRWPSPDWFSLPYRIDTIILVTHYSFTAYSFLLLLSLLKVNLMIIYFCSAYNTSA
ncbi:hypothetical protein ARMGADRAFT_1010772 [Armillaria gallica]|uniref:Uncharacterized protein n=1 Tax=Armillaria gallica TaxID=47427 RepID=A0A2H3DKW9_ARMGA|nr:hypothetical protein ARMGADRAFT_1010772 [Armillaria gallica]